MTKLKAPARIDPGISAWTVTGVLVGLPLTYWAKDAVLPWARQLFGDHNHRAFHGFWLSVVVLHWASVVLCAAVLRRHGSRPSELGVPDRPRAFRSIVAVALVGIIFVAIRSHLGRLTLFGGTPFFGSGAPASVVQRLVWVPVAITAGICEEFVYRGVALSLLRRRRLGVATSVFLAALSFALMHGPAGVFGFLFVGSLAVVPSHVVQVEQLRHG